MPLDMSVLPMVDAACFTAGKCLEWLPGAAFAVARLDRLEGGRDRAGGWSLDLADVYHHELTHGSGSHRFTPVPQALAALDLYAAEGGQPARFTRHGANMRALYDGVRVLGLHPTLPSGVQDPTVVDVDSPDDPAWNLQAFVDTLKRRGVLTSNFHCTEHPSFRVGCICAVTPDDMRRTAATMGEALDELGIRPRRAA